MTAQVPDKVKDKIKASIPLSRFGQPEDVAKAVKFLVSEESDYITGQVIACNGGLYI
ncbi:MAG: SDR family oxidoreductase [Planctomycetota bacterium]|jgi:NAD(P)-dependent dehydrogenase (short-subunit alcohol dehydrogenase family)